MSKCIDVNVDFKEIILGKQTSVKSNTQYKHKATVISCLAYNIFYFKMKCKNKETIFSEINLRHYLNAKMKESSEMYLYIDYALGNLMKKNCQYIAVNQSLCKIATFIPAVCRLHNLDRSILLNVYDRYTIYVFRTLDCAAHEAQSWEF